MSDQEKLDKVNRQLAESGDPGEVVRLRARRSVLQERLFNRFLHPHKAKGRKGGGEFASKGGYNLMDPMHSGPSNAKPARKGHGPGGGPRGGGYNLMDPLNKKTGYNPMDPMGKGSKPKERPEAESRRLVDLAINTPAGPEKGQAVEAAVAHLQKRASAMSAYGRYSAKTPGDDPLVNGPHHAAAAAKLMKHISSMSDDDVYKSGLRERRGWARMSRR